jgi:predicted transcriptional regulator
VIETLRGSDGDVDETSNYSRQVRLPQDISNRVDALANRWHAPSSEVMHAAITEYVDRHPA